MAQDDRSSSASRSAPPARDTAKLSEDITRVVNFLDTRRSDTSQRTTGLARGLAHRRDEPDQLPGRSGAQTSEPRAPAVEETPQPVSSSPKVIKNPELSVRYHSFCSELDHMLDSFRARVNSTKPVAH